jgi:hypothetical protein
MQRLNRAVGIAFAVGLLLAAIPGASAGIPVDPASLTPPPPEGATCEAVGGSTVICHTAVSFPANGEPLFDVGCGTVYQTSTDDRYGIRWYEDGLLARRNYRAALDGTWSLTPDGSGPSIQFTGNWSSSSIWTVPGDDATLVETFHGLHFHGTAPGLGGSLLLAGQIGADLTVHGVNTVDEPLGEISAAAIAAIESVLCV